MQQQRRTPRAHGRGVEADLSMSSECDSVTRRGPVAGITQADPKPVPPINPKA